MCVRLLRRMTHFDPLVSKTYGYCWRIRRPPTPPRTPPCPGRERPHDAAAVEAEDAEGSCCHRVTSGPTSSRSSPRPSAGCDARFLFGWHGQVGERWPVGPIGEELPPFVMGQVAVRDLPGEAFPGFEFHVPQHHTAAVGRGQRLAVGAEGHAVTLPSRTASGSPDRRRCRCTSHSTTPTPPPSTTTTPSRGQRVAVGAEGHASDGALGHGQRLPRQAVARSTSHSTTPLPLPLTAPTTTMMTPYAAARVLPSGLKATL